MRGVSGDESSEAFLAIVRGSRVSEGVYAYDSSESPRPSELECGLIVSVSQWQHMDANLTPGIDGYVSH